MYALISIKPKYVSKILSGEKKFEYRKSIFKRKIDRVYIYSSSPEKSIVGYFRFNGYFSNVPTQLWEETKTNSGITEVEFKQYFKGKSLGYALKLNKLVIFKEPINPYMVDSKFRPPQSFKYIDVGFSK